MRTPGASRNKTPAQQKTAKPAEIAEAADPGWAAAYIANMTGELAVLADKARFPTLAELLTTAQLEAELWSSQND
jgi:hypothetical protein